MQFFQNLVDEDPSTEQRSDEDASPKTELAKQLSFLSVGSGIFGFSQELDTETVSKDTESKQEPKLEMGSPPKVNSCILPGAFFSGSGQSSRKETISGSMITKSPTESSAKEDNSDHSPLVSATRSRNGSGASQRYVPPKGKYSQVSEQARDSDQQRFREWLTWDTDELEKRKRALIGKTVVGKLSPKRGNRYFVKWNINANDTIVISSDKVEEVLGETPPAGMWVSCTIVGLGPGHVQWNKQHPYAMTLESRETRASHQPTQGVMPRGSPHWKKTQKNWVDPRSDHRARRAPHRSRRD